MSEAKRIKDLEDRLPTVKVSKFDDSTKSLDVGELRVSTMATTETFMYNLKVTNPIHYVENAGGNVTSAPVVSVIVRRRRNNVESTLNIVTIDPFDNTTGYPITVALAKSSVQKSDRIFVDFKAPNAKTVTHTVAILR